MEEQNVPQKEEEKTEAPVTEEQADAPAEEERAPHQPLDGPKKVTAKLQIKTFFLDGSEEADKRMNEFLETIDNNKRFLNAREVTRATEGVFITFWYLEKLEEQPEVSSFGE